MVAENTCQALDILGTYLTSSATAPLNKEFVEIERPLWLAIPFSLSCMVQLKVFILHYSSYINFGEDARATLVDLPVYVGSVPTEYLDTFQQKFKDCLTTIANDKIHMKRMRLVIDRDQRQVRTITPTSILFRKRRS